MTQPYDELYKWCLIALIVTCFGFGREAAGRLWSWWTGKHIKPTATIARDQHIGRLLREIRTACKASRAFVAQFKNGQVYLSNNEEYRYTWTHEDTDAASSSVANRFNEIRTTLVPEEMALVEEAGPSFKPVSEMPDCTFQHMLLETGTLAVARCAIRSGKNIIGFIGLDFTKSTDSPERINELNSFAARMERLLTK